MAHGFLGRNRRSLRRVPSGRIPTPSAAGLLAIVALLLPRPAAPQVPGSLPICTLPLRLVGVAFDSARPTRSGAFIQCGDAQEKRGARLFAVGDHACDSLEVREVQAESVVVRNLALDRLEQLVLPASGSPPAARPSYPPSTARGSEPGIDPGPVVRLTAPDVITVELRKEELRRHLADLSGLLNAGLATPHYATGGSGQATIDGFEMSRIKPGGIVDQLGIRNGDVLLTFDGQKLDSLPAVMGLLGRAENLRGSRMTVLRNGSTLTFVFEVK